MNLSFNQNSDQENGRILNAAGAGLVEHFDTVQILVTWQDGGHTKSGYFHTGNAYARKCHLDCVSAMVANGLMNPRPTGGPDEAGKTA